MPNTRKQTTKSEPRRSGSQGPKDAPAPMIPRPKINKHGSPPPQQGLEPKPEMHPQQLNPIKGKAGQPQYMDDAAPVGSHSLRAVIAALRGS